MCRSADTADATDAACAAAVAAPDTQRIVVLQCHADHTIETIEHLEARGYRISGLRTDASGSWLAVRCSSSSVGAVDALCTSLQPRLPSLTATTSLDQALSLLFQLYGPRELVSGPASDDCYTGLGDPGAGLLRCFHVDDIFGGGAAAVGEQLCAQLRRDGYVPLVVPAAQRHIFGMVEADAERWFAQTEEEKLEQAGAYAHIDRKFTGYRNGKFREQLEVRATADGGVFPAPSCPPDFAARLVVHLRAMDRIARQLLVHVAADVGVDLAFLEGLTDPPMTSPVDSAPAPGESPSSSFLPTRERIDHAVNEASQRLRSNAASNADTEINIDGDNDADADDEHCPVLGHSLIRICNYDSDNEGVYGSGVLCEAHNDVGFITLDPCAAVSGLQVLRRSDGQWVPVEAVPPRADGSLVVVAMVGDTLGRLTANYYAPCKHRVVAPLSGKRVGLPFLFRGRSDAVLDTRAALQAAHAAGKTAHLAEMETTTIKELPAFDSAKSILRNWFKSVKKDE